MCYRLKHLFLFICLLGLIHIITIGQAFQPYEEINKRLIQGISFSPDGNQVYFTLPHKEFLQANGQKTDTQTPRLAIYKATRESNQWEAPQLLPFSGQFKDYEPSLSPDGRTLFFNSNKPQHGHTTEEKNNLWFSVWKGGKWSSPQYLTRINTSSLEESYATMTKKKLLIYVAEEVINGESKYAIYQTKFRGVRTKSGVKIAILDDEGRGVGDPWVAPDGSYLIFTKYDPKNWASTCDLYISFREGKNWTSPKPFTALNSPGPDFSPSVSPDGKWIYYRKNYQFVKYSLSSPVENLPNL